MNISIEKLASLRISMADSGIDAVILTGRDPHLGEYIPDHWRIINWLTGFSGSAATVVITDTFSGLWTDSRYFLQAEKQLSGSGFFLVKPDLPEKKDFIDSLKEYIKPRSNLSVDGRTISYGNMRRIEQILEGHDTTIDSETDLISELWDDRPPLPSSVAFDHKIDFCGKDRKIKILEVRQEMKKLNVDFHLLTSLDDIMWLLNIRGSDIKYTPLLISFALVGEEQILLFADDHKIPLKLASDFDRLGIVMLPYEEVYGMLSTLQTGSSVLINPSVTSFALFNAIPKGITIKEGISIPSRMKAIKNKSEIESIGRVMVKDGVALTKFLYHLGKNSGVVPMSEVSLSDKLNTLRSEQQNYICPSFPPIIAYLEHGALPHYSANSDTDYVIGTDGLLLVDSGGQYLDGTTDITRTICLGIPTMQQKRDFTLVLKGMISLANAKFPLGTKGYQVDILARKALWENGLNYGHGTGHGVGFFLNVHEGPQNIGPGTGSDTSSFIEPGMLFSDEPAIYREGEYGIRTENLIICYEDEQTEFGKFLKFDTVSLCYIDKSLIDINLLDKPEAEWLNSYHSMVYEKLSPHLTDTEKQWLRIKTEPI